METTKQTGNDSNFDDEEFDFTSNEDCISACYDAMATLTEFDFELMDKSYKERALKMKEKIFDMLEYSINEMHAEIDFDEKEM